MEHFNAEWVQVWWKERMKKEQAAALAAKLKMVEPKDTTSKCIPPATQESVIDVNEVEDVVVPVVE